MSKIEWTEEQLEAIENRDKNMLVSAAAGSGKTALLTERLKRLVLKDKVDCSRILVLTFTRAAAAEMKQRFKYKLYEALREDEWDLTNREIINQINTLTDSQISTIDSFATATIRRYFETVGVDPNFRIADSSEINLIIDEAIDSVFEKLFTQAEDNPNTLTQNFLKLIDIYGGTRTNENLKKEITTFLKFLETIPYPEEWIEETYKNVDNLDKETYINSPVFKALYEEVENIAKRLIENFEEIELLKSEIPFKKGAAGKANLEKAIEIVFALKGIENSQDLLKAIINLKFPTIYFPKGVDPIVKQQIQDLGVKANSEIRNEVKNIQNKFSNIDFDKDFENMKKANEVFKAFTQVAKLVYDAIMQKKEEMGILYFNDLSRYFLKLLEDENVRESIKREYQYIYLDEYQDSATCF